MISLSHRGITAWALKGAALVLVAGTARQEIFAQSANPEGPPTFRIESQLVVLDFAVTDDKGKIVDNLSRDDVTVYENGVEQSIRSFETYVEKRPHAIPVNPALDRAGNQVWGDAPLTMLVIDALNTPFDETAYARNQVEKYLKNQPALLTQPTIVFWLDDNGYLPVKNGFTRDRDALLAAVTGYKATLPSNLARGDQITQLGLSLMSLQQMAVFCRGNKGPKQIIWVGRSFPGLDSTTFNQKQLELMHKAVSSTLDRLMEARAVVYAIDPMAAGGDELATADTPIQEDPNEILAFNAKDPFEHSFNLMGLVKQSGGNYFYGRNDINHEIEDSIDLDTRTYTLSYIPAEPIADGNFRKVDIRLRDPHLHVQSKQGYYPASPDTAPDMQDLQFDLREALTARVAYGGLGVRITNCALDADRITSSCAADVDNNTLTFTPSLEGGRQVAKFLYVIGAMGTGTNLLNNHVKEAELGISQHLGPADDRGWSHIRLTLIVPPNTKRVRVAVRDSSGLIGTADVDSKVLPSLFPKVPLRVKK